MNIVEPILFQATFQPEAPALCVQGGDIITYAKLAAQIHSVAQRAVALGLKRGDVAALSIDNQLLHAVVILGLAKAGIVSVSVAMQKPPAGLKLNAVIANTNYPFALDVRRLPLDATWTSGQGSAVDAERDRSTAGDEACRIILTSGTTGDPKAVVLSHSLVWERIVRYDYLFGSRFPLLSRFYMNIGAGAAFGYYLLIYALGRGGLIFYRGDSIENTLRAVEMFQIEAMLATPATLAAMIEACDRYPGIEVHFDAILSTGNLLSQTMVDRIVPRLCSQLIVGYGATETARTTTAQARRIAHIDNAVGYIVPGAKVEIVDESNSRVAPGVQGIVRVASDVAVDRYIDDPIESAKAFRGGWFYPGDLGALTADGLLTITGRQTDLLNIGGSKMAAEKVEMVLCSFAAVSEAAVFGMSIGAGIGEVWAAVVCRAPLDQQALRIHCRAQLPEPFVPVRIAVVDALPQTLTGKIDRQYLRRTLVEDAERGNDSDAGADRGRPLP